MSDKIKDYLKELVTRDIQNRLSEIKLDGQRGIADNSTVEEMRGIATYRISVATGFCLEADMIETLAYIDPDHTDISTLTECLLKRMNAELDCLLLAGENREKYSLANPWRRGTLEESKLEIEEWNKVITQMTKLEAFK